MFFSGNHCGSGGCDLFIFTPEQSSFQQLARTSVTQPPVRVLDSRTGGELMDLLRELNEDGATLVIITHDEEIAASLPRRIAVRDGLVEADR